MKKIGSTSLAIGILAAGLILAVPDHKSSGSVSTASGTHGLLAPFTDAELTEHAGSVVVGQVISKEIVALKDDPDLPTPLSPLGKELVDAGMAQVKWHVRVGQWLKGSGPEEIIVVQAHSSPTAGLPGSGTAIAEIEDPAQGLFGALTHDQIQSGSTYTFWVDKYDWFKKNYYVLARAKAPSQ
jgi:hypothetical protein